MTLSGHTWRIGRRLADIGMLYFSKSGAIVVNLLILPRLQLLLSPDAFGLVALFATLQALLLTLDLGLSTLVSREIALAAPHSVEPLRVWHTAEIALSLAHLIAALGLLLVAAVGWIVVSPGEILLAAAALWLLTLQNISYTALLAKQDFIVASSLLVAGAILRGSVSLIAVMVVPTFTAFLLAQLSTGLVQFVIMHLRCRNQLRHNPAVSMDYMGIFPAVGALLWRARSLSLFGISGAIVLQADKLILSALTSPAEMAPYFLASTICFLPISVLAGPLVSFFQPRILRARTQDNVAETVLQMRRFTIILILAVLLPTTLLWFLSASLVDAWLIGSPNAPLVAEYTKVLLPGYGLGALGFLAYIALLAHGDFSFQARLSVILTIITLTSVALAATAHNVRLVCWIYTIYHSGSTILSWTRWHYLERAANSRLALTTATPAAVAIALIGSVAWLLSNLIEM